MDRAGKTSAGSSYCVVVVVGVAALTIPILSRFYVDAPYQKPFAIGTALLLTAGAFALNKCLPQRAEDISFKDGVGNAAGTTINPTAAGATSTGGQGAPLSGNQSTGTSTVNFTVPGSNNATGSITGQITGNGNFTGPTSPLSSTLPGTTINPTAAGATSTGGQSTGTSTVNFTEL